MRLAERPHDLKLTVPSSLVGLLAASIPDRSRVLVANGEFTSLSWPFAAQAGRGVVITEVSRDRLAERISFHLYNTTTTSTAPPRPSPASVPERPPPPTVRPAGFSGLTTVG